MVAVSGGLRHELFESLRGFLGFALVHGSVEDRENLSLSLLDNFFVDMILGFAKVIA
jgi:hypothetical protein